MDRPDVVDWVGRHLAGLYAGDVGSSAAFVGGQSAADEALATFDVTGYAAARNEAWPATRRGASRLSPYIRHGMLSLPRVWEAVAGGPARDVAKFRDELLWQEYARHVYARVGRATRTGLRYRIPATEVAEPWPRTMACVDRAVGELESDGWLVNQMRMWLASQWSVRMLAPWQRGEETFFVNLLDGSRAANRLGWQWTAGTATGRAYGFSRFQVEKRAPGLCATCRHDAECPIDGWPPDPPLEAIEPHSLLRGDANPASTAGPERAHKSGRPDAVWLTAESLGDDDPALAANPELPAVFVFDERLLARLQLTAKRLVFLTETLADLARRRRVEVHLGDPAGILEGRPVAATFTPVPGWHTRAARIQPVQIYPWPWLRRPDGGSVASFSAWRRHADRSNG
jgi:deoxyribodipyrimidine photo-lyase